MLSTATLGPSQMGLDLMSAVDAAITAFGGSWSFIEQWSPAGTPTTIFRVYKCSGLLNSAGVDFYFSVSRTSNTSNLTFQFFEGYNATTHQLTDPVPGVVNGSSPVAGSFSVPTSRYTTGYTGLLDSSVNPFYNMQPFTVAVSAATSATYWISITNDRIIVFTTVSNGVYLGCMDRLQSSSIDPAPLIAAQLALVTTFQATGNTGAGYTREPNMPQNQFNWIAAINTWNWLPVNPFKEWLSGQFWPSKLICLVDGPRGTATGFSAARGMLKDLLYQQMTAGAIGDQMTVDGVTYIRAPNSFWLSAAA